jgi:hypothetical protein
MAVNINVRRRGRWAGVAVALLLVMTSATSAKAQAAPTMTITPNCDAPAGPGRAAKLSITVEGFNFPQEAPGSQFNEVVYLYFASVAQGITDEDANGHFKTVITPNRPAAGLYLVRADSMGQSFSKPFRLPCPSIALDPNCGPVGARPETYSIKVTGYDFYGTPSPTTTQPPPVIKSQPFSAAAAGPGSGAPSPRGATAGNTVTIVFGKTDTFTAVVDASGTFSTVITPLRRPASTYAVVATDSAGFGGQSPGGFVVPCPSVPTVTQPTTGTTRPTGTTTATTPPTAPPTTAPPVTGVPGPTPTVSCSPCVGTPGLVTLVAGSGFGPGTSVNVRWEPGLGSVVVTADPAGGFRTSMLVFPRDQLGPRLIIAEGPGGSSQVAFLAVTPSVNPSGRDVQIQGVRRLVRLVQR